MSSKILERSFMRFLKIINDVSDFANNYVNDEKEKTLKLTEKIIELKINNLFTNDNDYMNNYMALFISIKKWFYHRCFYRIRKIKNKDNNSNNNIINHKR